MSYNLQKKISPINIHREIYRNNRNRHQSMTMIIPDVVHIVKNCFPHWFQYFDCCYYFNYDWCCSIFCCYRRSLMNYYTKCYLFLLNCILSLFIIIWKKLRQLLVEKNQCCIRPSLLLQSDIAQQQQQRRRHVQNRKEEEQDEKVNNNNNGHQIILQKSRRQQKENQFLLLSNYCCRRKNTESIQHNDDDQYYNYRNKSLLLFHNRYRKNRSSSSSSVKYKFYMMLFMIYQSFISIRNNNPYSIVLVHGYPSFLLSSNSCWTKLSTNEVIMNYPVVSYENSDDQDMYIRAFIASDGTDTDLLPHHIDKTTVLIPNGFPAVVSLHVVTTNKDTDPDYQWAMDVVVPLNEESMKPTYTPLAHFVDGSCPNRIRTAGRSDEVISVTIDKDGAELVAAWSAGHEKVRLTPILKFVSTIPTTKIIVDEKDNNDKNREDKQNEADTPKTDPQKLLDEKILVTDGGLKHIQDQVQQHKQHLMDKQNDINIEVTNSHALKDKGSPVKNKKKRKDDSFIHRQTFTDQEERIKEFLLQDKYSDASASFENKTVNHGNGFDEYNNNNQHPFRFELKNLFFTFSNPSTASPSTESKLTVTFSSYIKGGLLFIILMLLSTKICIWASKRHLNNNGSMKGRRDL